MTIHEGMQPYGWLDEGATTITPCAFSELSLHGTLVAVTAWLPSITGQAPVAGSGRPLMVIGELAAPLLQRRITPR